MPEIDISRGLQLDDPHVFVSWDIREAALIELLGRHGLKKVAAGYYCISCTSLGGLPHELGFHFESRADEKRNEELEEHVKSIGTLMKKIGPRHDSSETGKLRELEFYRRTYPDLKKSFDEFQVFFERAFGQPSHSKKGRDGFQHHEWRLGKIGIFHYVIDRFGPEERLGIRKG